MLIKISDLCLNRISRGRQEAASLGCFVRCHQEQKTPNMAEDPRTHYAQVPGAVCRPAQESPGQRGSLPVQEHLPAGWFETINAASSEPMFFSFWDMEAFFFFPS